MIFKHEGWEFKGECQPKRSQKNELIMIFKREGGEALLGKIIMLQRMPTKHYLGLII